MIGKLRYWNHVRAFGFIESKECDNSVFVHFTAVGNRAPDQIDVGDVVEFDIGADREGRQQAKNARVLDRPATDCTDIRLGDIGADGTT
jgi:cold shock CspA family protein